MMMNNDRDVMQGKTIYQDKNGGIIISGNSLAVQNIQRHNEGNYSCLAANDVGRMESQPIHLNIKCKLQRCQTKVSARKHKVKPLTKTNSIFIRWGM